VGKPSFDLCPSGWLVASGCTSSLSLLLWGLCFVKALFNFFFLCLTHQDVAADSVLLIFFTFLLLQHMFIAPARWLLPVWVLFSPPLLLCARGAPGFFSPRLGLSPWGTVPPAEKVFLPL